MPHGMSHYQRTWRQERRPLEYDFEPECPTGRACVWPTIVLILAAAYLGAHFLVWVLK